MVAAPEPVVLTVSVADFPGTKVLGEIEHCGPSGCTEHDKLIEPLKPPIAVTFSVELAEAPALIALGASAEADSKNPGDTSENAVPR